MTFVRSAADVLLLKEHLARLDAPEVPVIAKIEKPQGVDAIDEILAVVEGIMVARGDLGVEMPLELVPVIQKRLIHAANDRGVLVITATQMLDSMERNPRPTRAESTDVANAIVDGTDAVMLSGETANGRYPVRAVEVMDRIEANPRTRELAAEPSMAELSELRRRIGPHLSDEEFLLRATMPANLVDAMEAAGPAPRGYDPRTKPVMDLLKVLLARTDLTRISVEKAGFKLELEADA